MPVATATAYFAVNPDSTFGEWDKPTGISIKTMKLSFSDTENGIESFILTMPDKAPNGYGGIMDVFAPVNYPDLYQPNGKEVLIDFNSFNTATNESFKFKIPNIEINDLTYGAGYTIDSTKPIKILNSKLELPEDDSGGDLGIFNVDPNDKIKLNLKYSSENKNIIKADPTTEVKADDTDIQLVSESAEKESKIDLSFLIPLVSNSNPTERKDVTATIKLSNGNLIFNSGLTNASSNNNTSTGATDSSSDSNNENSAEQFSEETGVTEGTGFGGHGVKIPRKDTYKGLSTEVNFDNYIAGITNFILTFVAVIAVIMLVYGGYLWITDQGDESGAEKAKKIIASSVIGIFIIISAYTVINTVIGMEGNDSPGCNIDIGNLNELDCNFNNLDEITPALVTQGMGAVVGKQVGETFGGDTGGIIGGLLGVSGGNAVGNGVQGILGGDNFFKGLFK